MSLIFEALKKLDREKQSPERGFLVVGSSAWGAARRSRALPIVLALSGAAVLGFLVARWSVRPRPQPTPVAGSAPATPAPVVAPPTTPVTFAAPAPSVVSAAAAPPGVPSPRPAAEPIARSGSAQATGPAAPTAPVPPAAEPAPLAEPTYALQAVTEQDGQPVAIVNGQLVRVGDTVEGALVLRIDADAVQLEKDGRRFVIAF